jgi:hypothetical protein
MGTNHKVCFLPMVMEVLEEALARRHAVIVSGVMLQQKVRD